MLLAPDTKLHSREHVLAEDLSQMLHEPKRFAAYLGIAKRYDESDLRALARYVVEKKDLPVEVRGKYFFASLRRLIRKPEVKKAKRRTKKKKNGKRAKYNGNSKRAGSRAPQKSS
ncbi:MAG: hypothetical protein HY007_00850 [Candidatus Sungbacteria bacterium]|nr:hypothetical protein [Candidatus Sungbacteria bacterium]